MAFNADEFRKKAEAAGLDAAAIQAEIDYQTSAAKPDVFAKDQGGFKLSSPEQLHERMGNDWWHLPAAAAAGSAAASVLPQFGKAVYDWYKQKSTPVNAPRVEPTLKVEEIAAPDRLQQAAERVAQGRAAGLGVPPAAPQAVAPAVPAAPTAPAAVPAAPAAAPAAPPAPVVAADPTATGTQVAEAVVREELNAPKGAVAPKAEGVTGRVRRTQAQIAQAATEAAAKAPPGMIPSAPAKTNKMPGDVIGQGGWHWFSGQGGTPEEWLRAYGRTNQPYSRVVSDVKGGVISVPPPPEGQKGGRIPRGEYVPEYIKGQASIPGLISTGLNALGALGLLQAYKQGQQTGDYSDFGLGAIGQVLGNIAPRAGVGASLMTPTATNVGEQEELAKRRKKPATID